MREALHRRNSRQAGYSVVEALITSLIFVSLLAAVYGALGDSRTFSDVQNTYAKMQMDARKVVHRVADELKMTGWVPNTVPGQPSYPYVFANGMAEGVFASESHAPPTQHVDAGSPAFGEVSSIVFKIPQDVDGDGLLTASATGNIEWSPSNMSYVLETDASGVNVLHRREDGVVTDLVARYVERITFDTIKTDPSVGMNEIVITVYMARPIRSGQWLEANLTTCVTMRNVEEVE